MSVGCILFCWGFLVRAGNLRATWVAAADPCMSPLSHCIYSLLCGCICGFLSVWLVLAGQLQYKYWTPILFDGGPLAITMNRSRIAFANLTDGKQNKEAKCKLLKRKVSITINIEATAERMEYLHLLKPANPASPNPIHKNIKPRTT